MKIILVILLLVSGPVACTTAPKPNQSDSMGESPYSRVPQKKIAEAVRYAKQGVPFPVDIDPFGAVYDGPIMGGELQHLKDHFLLPLAKSRYAAKIQRVRIDASALEWYQWTCTIELKDDMAPISITHFAGLYDGHDNQDPDGYVRSRQYALAALDNIGSRVGWVHE